MTAPSFGPLSEDIVSATRTPVGCAVVSRIPASDNQSIADNGRTARSATIMTKAALEPQGRWEECKAELIALYHEHNESSDGSFSASAEYLLTVAQMPA